MRAYEVRGVGLENLISTERPRPQPLPHQVVLKMKAASLNYRDLMILRGEHPVRGSGMVPLSDGVGEVVEVGKAVQRFRVGDRVAGIFTQAWLSGRAGPRDPETALGGEIDGVLAEYVALDEQGAVQVPEHLTDEEAATLACAGVTAWHALFEAGNVRPGDTVLVQGTGGVSIFALQFARLAGARVLVTSSSDEKLAKARNLGADDGVNYRTTPDWDQWAIEATGGQGVDHVVDVGGPGTFGRSLTAVRRQGDVSVIGVLTGTAGDAPLLDILFKQVRVLGIYVGSREMFDTMNAAIRQNKLRPVVDRVFNFSQVVDAYRHLASGKHFGKVVIRIPA